MIEFTPMSDKELEELNLIAPGTYAFEVIEAKDTISQAKNPMIELKLKIQDDAGKTRFVFDRILGAFPKKINHFCKTTGLMEQYLAGKLGSVHCSGKQGHVVIIKEEEKPNPKGGVYKAKNSVEDYVVLTETKLATDDFVSDDVPF